MMTAATMTATGRDRLSLTRVDMYGVKLPAAAAAELARGSYDKKDGPHYRRNTGPPDSESFQEEGDADEDNRDRADPVMSAFAT